MINTVFLNTFRVLAETNSFVETAKKLRMTQPGVSQHLKSLEDYFGCELATRKGRFFQLTDAGTRVKAYSDELFASHDEFKAGLLKDDPQAGSCFISSTGSFGLKLYSHLIELSAKHSLLNMHMTVAPNLSVIRALLDGKIMMGFVSESPSDPLVEAKQISEEQLLLVTPHTHKSIEGLADLAALGFIAHPDGYAYANRLLSVNFPKEFRSIDDLPKRGEINQINRILDPIAAGVGFTVIPEFAFAAYPQQKKLHAASLKKKVVDPIFAVQKKLVKLPARYQFVLESLKKAL